MRFFTAGFFMKKYQPGPNSSPKVISHLYKFEFAEIFIFRVHSAYSTNAVTLFFRLEQIRMYSLLVLGSVAHIDTVFGQMSLFNKFKE
jgi:hypothetical protein